MNFLDLKDQKNLIEGVILYPLKINRDPRGILVEALKVSWPEIFGLKRPFTQNYYSLTDSFVARDEDQWHFHPTKQEDRFVVISGDIIVAVFDWRKESTTFNTLNLFKMGQNNNDDNQYLLLIPKNVLHGFCVVSKAPAILLNFPTSLYDKNEEGRIKFDKAGAKFPDGAIFNWQAIKKQFKKS